MAASGSAAEKIWTSDSFGAGWSVGPLWNDSTPPPASGAADLTLRFRTSGSSQIRSTHDLGATFLLSNLALESEGAGLLLIDAQPGKSLRLTGSAPKISVLGLGDHTVSAPLSLSPTTGVVSVVGPGFGNLTISGVISLTSATGLLIDAPAASAETGVITLSGANTFTGGVVLQAGNLAVGNNSGLGSGTLRVKGGTFRSAASNLTIANPIALESDLVITGNREATLAGVISSAVPGTGLALRTPGRFVLTAPATYSGATSIDHGLTGNLQFATGGGLLHLSGNGSILNTSAIKVASGGLLYSSGSTAGATNRIPDAAPITLRGGGLLFSGSASSINTQTERVGSISAAGAVRMVAGESRTNIRLTAASLARLNRGTVSFSGAALGASPSTSSTNIYIDGGLPLVGGGGSGADTSVVPFAIGERTTGGADTSVVPFAIGERTTGVFDRVYSFVTYDAINGVRPLDENTDYVKTLPAPAATNNVSLDADPVLATGATVNALRFGAATALSGTGTLTVTSGALLSPTADVNISVPLNFGAAEAQLFAEKALTLSAPISGSNGLTKSGNGTLIIRGGNTITGPLTINNGYVDFQTVADLGASAEAITISGPLAGLAYSGAGTVTLTRAISIGSGFGQIVSNGGGVLEISGGISGASLHASGLSGTVRLSGTNTHSGVTVLTGQIELDGDEALGSGEVHASGTLRLRSPWTTSRTLQVSNGLTIDTAGHDSALSGMLLGTAKLTKVGAGTLTLAGRSPLKGEVRVGGGTLRLTGAAQLRTESISLPTGGRLLLDDLPGTSSSRLNDRGAISFEGGELAFAGNASAPSREKVGFLGLTRGMSSLSLEPAAGQPLTLEAAGLFAATGTLLVRGEQLGAPAGGTTARLVFPNSYAPGALVPGIYDAPTPGSGETFTTYDSTSDAVGVVGVKRLKSSDYTPVGTIENPAVAPTAHVLVGSGATTTGAANSVASLTFAPGGSLTLDAGETLSVTSGQVLARSGGPATLAGGALNFGAANGRLTAFSDMTIDSAVNGTAGWSKLGNGVLTLGTQPASATPLTLASGPLRVSSLGALAAQTLTVIGDGVFDLNGGLATVGALAGDGEVAIGTGALRLGTLGTSFPITSRFTGTGSLTLVSGQPHAIRSFPEVASSFAGPVVLESGNVVFKQSDQVTQGPLVFAGGGIALKNSVTFNRDVVLNTEFKADQRVESVAPRLTFTAPARITGGGALRHTAGEMEIGIPVDFTGPTLVEGSGILTTLSLSGAGALRNTSAIELRSGAQLFLRPSGDGSPADYARLPDTAPLRIELSTLDVVSAGTTSAMETIGPLRAAPGARVNLSGNDMPVGGLAAAALEREPGGTLIVGGTALGKSAVTPHHELRLAAAPALVGGGGTGPNRSLLPWGLAATNSQTSFLTWDAGTGLRQADSATEFVAGPAAVQQPTNNLRISGDYALSSPLTVNALLIDQQTQGTGAGRLTVASGGVLIQGNATISHPLDFGAAEGVLHLGFSTVELRGQLTGTSGLTVSGGALTVTGANAISGPLHLQNAGLRFDSPEDLGVNSKVFLSDGALYYTGSSPLTFTRGLEVSGVNSNFGGAPVGTTTLAGNISGLGRLRLATAPGGAIHLTGTNTHTGGTKIDTTVTFASDAALGAGAIILGSGVLRATFPWTTDRTILGGGGFDTNGFDVTWTGRVGSGFDKFGPGTLTLRGRTGGDIEVFAGTLALEGAVAEGEDGYINSIRTMAGATLTGTAVTKHYLESSGTLAPGSGVGTLTVLDTTFRAGSVLTLELAAADRYDRLQVQGTVLLDGDVTLELALSFDPADGIDSFLLIANDGFQPINLANGRGFFRIGDNQLSEGEIFSVGAQAFRISYMGGTGNDLVLYAVPEPGAAGMIACAAFALLARRRR